VSRILLIEDNPADRRLIQEGLAEDRERQCMVTVAGNLAEAVDYLRQPAAFDLVLLDLNLPDSQGMETIDRVRVHANGLPVVVLTGMGDEEFGVDALKRGAQDYVVKGIPGFDHLPRTVRSRTWAVEAVCNLVANALKFTDGDEHPDIEIAPYESSGADGDPVGIVVRDRGPGIPPEQRERVFLLFQRGVASNVEGTGAGLAIVKEVAERHGGSAWVAPRAGGGSEFVITFGGPSRHLGEQAGDMCRTTKGDEQRERGDRP